MKLHIGTYSDTSSGYSGFIEPEDRAWIVFVGVDGSATFFGERDATGAVVVAMASDEGQG